MRASRPISPARISSSPSTQTGTRGGVDPSRDPGGNHPGFDADTGARVAKLPPGTLALQHDVYGQGGGTEVVAYLGDWAIYGRRFDFSKLPVKNLNRLVYGFAGICFPGAHNTQDPGFPTTAPAAVNRNCSASTSTASTSTGSTRPRTAPCPAWPAPTTPRTTCSSSRTCGRGCNGCR